MLTETQMREIRVQCDYFNYVYVALRIDSFTQKSLFDDIKRVYEASPEELEYAIQYTKMRYII